MAFAPVKPEIPIRVAGLRHLIVKFQISENETIAQSYPNSLKVHEIRADIARKFNIESKFIDFKRNDRLLDSSEAESSINLELSLSDIGNEFGVVELRIELTEEAEENEVALDTNFYYSQYALNDIIRVQIAPEMAQDGVGKDLIVEIENRAIKKPFLGGYFNKLTQIEFHDSFTQTGPLADQIERLESNVVTRDTQTVELKPQLVSTPTHQAVQAYGDTMRVSFLPDDSDYVIEAKEYESVEKKLSKMNVEERVILIQRNFRRYLWQKLIKESAAEWRALVERQKHLEKRKKKDKIDREKKTVDAKAFPKTKKDFDVLFAQVETWKEAEIKRISEQYSGGPKIAELNAVLDKEIKLLMGIEKKRIELKQEMEDERNKKFLQKLGKPVQWIGYKNKLIEMDTLRTQRARYLTKYYDEMRQESTDKDTRLVLLTKVIPVIYGERHSKVQELVELLDRERNMLIRDVKGECLDTLRKRQNVLFLDIIKNEENGPKKEIKRKLCTKCKTVRTVEEFAMGTRQTGGNICCHCIYLNAPPTDQTVYHSILRAIRRDERKRGALASFAFLLQADDIKYLVERIWHGHSILSQCEVRSDLRLPRFNIAEDWAPWNCICLTEAEARLHVKIGRHLDLVYEANLMKDIKNKHELGRAAFRQIKEVDHSFVESGTWWQAGLDVGGGGEGERGEEGVCD